MVDKNLETDREVTMEYELEVESTNNFEALSKIENVLIDVNLIEQKKAADRADKVSATKPFSDLKLINFVPLRFVQCAASSTHKKFSSKSSKIMLSRISVTTATSKASILTSTSSLFHTP